MNIGSGEISIQSLVNAIEYYRRSKNGTAGVDFNDVIGRLEAGDFNEPDVVLPYGQGGRAHDPEDEFDQTAQDARRPVEQPQGRSEPVSAAGADVGHSRLAAEVEEGLTSLVSFESLVRQSNYKHDARSVSDRGRSLDGRSGNQGSKSNRPALFGSDGYGDWPETQHILDMLQALQRAGLNQLFDMLARERGRSQQNAA